MDRKIQQVGYEKEMDNHRMRGKSGLGKRKMGFGKWTFGGFKQNWAQPG